jgi:hypothetical protein
MLSAVQWTSGTKAPTLREGDASSGLANDTQARGRAKPAGWLNLLRLLA